MFFHESPGVWLGQGFIHMRGIAEKLPFYTRWTIGDDIVQEVEIKGLAAKQVNVYTVSPDKLVTLENEDLGIWQGSLLQEGHHLSWKLFSPDQIFSGEEHFYHLDNGRIKTRASFFDQEGLYTLVEGEIWPRAKD